MINWHAVSIPAKENVKTASYSVVIIVGLGVTGLIFYTVYKVIIAKDLILL